jgi:hypothetical protein
MVLKYKTNSLEPGFIASQRLGPSKRKRCTREHPFNRR